MKIKRIIMYYKKYLPLKYYDLRLRLDSCWISKLEKNFGEIECSILNIKPLENFLNLLVLIKFENSFSEKKLAEFFEKMENVYNYSYTQKNGIFLFMVNCQCKHHDNNYFNIPHFEIYPISQKNEIRHLRIASPIGINIKKIKEGLLTHDCNPTIIKVLQYKKVLYDLSYDLTNVIYTNETLNKKEKRDIHLAAIEGFYDIPRKKNLSEIAEKYEVARSTYQFHVRNAESKIIKNFLECSAKIFKR